MPKSPKTGKGKNNLKKEIIDEVEDQLIKFVKLIKESECQKSFAKIKEYLDPSIKMFGKRYRIPGCDPDEIEQQCLIALRYKVVDDFDPSKGKFKTFAILCLKRHLFSLIKGSNQQKRRVLNQSLSLNEDRSGSDDDNLSLISIVEKKIVSADDEYEINEEIHIRRDKILAILSPMEKEVYLLYIQRYHYDEIVEKIKSLFPDRKIKKKTVDNSLERAKTKIESLDEKDLFAD